PRHDGAVLAAYAAVLRHDAAADGRQHRHARPRHDQPHDGRPDEPGNDAADDGHAATATATEHGRPRPRHVAWQHTRSAKPRLARHACHGRHAKQHESRHGAADASAADDGAASSGRASASPRARRLRRHEQRQRQPQRRRRRRRRHDQPHARREPAGLQRAGTARLRAAEVRAPAGPAPPAPAPTSLRLLRARCRPHLLGGHVRRRGAPAGHGGRGARRRRRHARRCWLRRPPDVPGRPRRLAAEQQSRVAARGRGTGECADGTEERGRPRRQLPWRRARRAPWRVPSVSARRTV
ncbi:hypothetical protein LTR16_005308, partial [Cryomyces antarcticus]